jgi:transposase
LQQTLQPIIKATVAKGALVHTDEYSVYARLRAWGYQHKTVCHARREYARDEDGDGFCEVYGNTIEGFWSLLRSWLRPHRSLAAQAAALPRLLPDRAQRTPSGQSPPWRARCRLGRMTHKPNTPEANKSHQPLFSGRGRNGRCLTISEF